MVSVTLRPLYPREKNPSAHCIGHCVLSGPQSRSRRCGEEKNYLHLTGIEPRFSARPFSSLVNIPTELWEDNVKRILDSRSRCVHYWTVIGGLRRISVEPPSQYIQANLDFGNGGLPCGGGLEYLHRSPVSRRRWGKENPVPRGITGPPCHWGTYIEWPGPPGWGWT
jgi:hypothetical protein